jgi:hypothetical protein
LLLASAAVVTAPAVTVLTLPAEAVAVLTLPAEAVAAQLAATALSNQLLEATPD